LGEGDVGACGRVRGGFVVASAAAVIAAVVVVVVVVIVIIIIIIIDTSQSHRHRQLPGEFKLNDSIWTEFRVVSQQRDVEVSTAKPPRELKDGGRVYLMNAWDLQRNHGFKNVGVGVD